MNRARRGTGQTKPFVMGGNYDGGSAFKQQLKAAKPQQQQQQQQPPPTSSSSSPPPPSPSPSTQKPQQSQQQQPQPTPPQKQQQQQSQPKTPSLKIENQNKEQTPSQPTQNTANQLPDSNKTLKSQNAAELMQCDDTADVGTNENQVDVPEENGDRKTFFKKIFVRKKSSIRAKEKKMRQNRHLRKVILPKNALMALNEVKGIQIGDFVINSNTGGGFTAVVSVNQNQYEGRGSSKAIAKNNACEKALRDFVIAKMLQKPRRNTNNPSQTETMDTESNDGTAIESDGGNSINGGGGNSATPNDDSDVPMVNLASFALYKLFTEWENEGFHIPEFHTGSQIIPPADGGETQPEKPPRKATIRTDLPLNWEAMHPATLLCMMRPGLTYSNWGSEGEKPNVIQILSVVVDDEEFMGRGRSKKIARKNTAIAVCNQLFGTNFVKEEECPI